MDRRKTRTILGDLRLSPQIGTPTPAIVRSNSSRSASIDSGRAIAARTASSSPALAARVATAGQGEGIAFDFDRQSRNPNTLDGPRVIRLAGERGVQGAVAEALFVADFTEGRDLSDRATLTEVASGAKLDRAGVDEKLACDTGLEVARAGEARARHLGASGVPSFVVNGKVAPSGARPPGLFLRAIGRASESVVIGESCEVDPATGERACWGRVFPRRRGADRCGLG